MKIQQRVSYLREQIVFAAIVFPICVGAGCYLRAATQPVMEPSQVEQSSQVEQQQPSDLSSSGQLLTWDSSDYKITNQSALMFTGDSERVQHVMNLVWWSPGSTAWRVEVFNDARVVLTGDRATIVREFLPVMMQIGFKGGMFTMTTCEPESTPDRIGRNMIVSMSSNVPGLATWYVDIGTRGTVEFEGDVPEPARVFWREVGQTLVEQCDTLDSASRLNRVVGWLRGWF